MNVTVLGLGPMGQALATALLDAKYRTTVWNRTAAKADPLLARGALVAADAAEAVAAADLTLINVVDHEAVDAILAAAGTAVAGKIIVGLSSDTPERSRRTAALVAAGMAEGCRRLIVRGMVRRRYARLDKAWERAGPDWGRTGAGS